MSKTYILTNPSPLSRGDLDQARRQAWVRWYATQDPKWKRIALALTKLIAERNV